MQISPKTFIEPFYLLGEFGVKVAGRDVTVITMPRKLVFGDLNHQGFPFYSGSYTYHCEYDANGEPCKISCHDFFAPLLGITVDGKRKGSIIAAPYEIDLGTLSKGKHNNDITVFGNRYNTFGPLHNNDENYAWYGECAWETHGAYFAYEYHFKPFGIFTSPRIIHLSDIAKLLDCLNKLVDQGHSVIVIEHHLDVIKSADYIIDLGPEGGNQGGYIVAEGTPEQLVKVKESYTGMYLRTVL